MRHTRHWLEFLPLFTLALPVATGSLTAQTRYLLTVSGPIDSVVANGAQNSVFGFIPNTTSGSMDTFGWNGTTWSLITANGPAARTAQAMSGAPSGGVIMIGGVPSTATPVTNATHHFDGSVWTTIAVAASPSLRSGAGCAQLGNGNVVLFGGSDATSLRGDTWIFDGTNWTNPTNTGPTPRVFPAMGSDGNGNVLLFGGLDVNGVQLNDTWLFSGTSWSQVFPATSPTSRFGAALASDPKIALSGVANRTSVVLAGGFDLTLGVLTDVWVFFAGNWTLQPFTTPAINGFATCAFDGVHREVVFAEYGAPATTPYVVGEFGFTKYGSGCACPSGVPAMAPSTLGPPRLGLTTSWEITGGVPGAFVFLVMDFAPANIPWSTACTQLVGSGSTLGVGLNAAGAATVPVAVPTTVNFIGTHAYGQMIDVVNFCGSDGIEMRVGR